ncbi:MAG: FkbM family methyltransferase [Bacteroidia bacterium]
MFSVFKIKTLKYDKNESDFLYFLKLIPPGTAIFDIGANIGIMTVYLAKQFNDSQVYSFEPMPDNLKALKRVLQYFKLKNVTIIECALGTENGQLEMVMPVRNNVKFQGLSHAVHESITENNEGVRFTVPMKSLDGIPEFKNMKQPLGAIKIDVENFEYFVLKGGEQLLRTYKPIVYAELWDTENRTNCFEMMKDIGYEIKILDKDKLIDFDAAKHSKQNFFFVC